MNCLLCGSNQSSIFARVESFGFPLVYLHCDHCGLIYQSEEDSKAADPDFYASTYRKIYQSTEEPTGKDLWVQQQRANHMVKLLETEPPEQPGRILDVGASTGVLLKAFQDAFSCEITGVEPGDAYRAYAENRGIPMYPSLEALTESKEGKFSVVSLIHVLEHLPDPVGMLRSIRQDLLDEKGYLLLEVPNFYTHDSYELAHLACYTPHTLQEVLRQAGFETETLKKHGLPRSTLLNLYLTVIARPLPDGDPVSKVKPEKRVALKRKAGLFYRRIVQKLFPHQAWLPLGHGKDD
jgi:2-polyprenyl-3-methyl-5-hydroxy-6-metoxy-1,4-benzoquinol methylase